MDSVKLFSFTCASDLFVSNILNLLALRYYVSSNVSVHIVMLDMDSFTLKYVIIFLISQSLGDLLFSFFQCHFIPVSNVMPPLNKYYAAQIK